MDSTIIVVYSQCYGDIIIVNLYNQCDLSGEKNRDL